MKMSNPLSMHVYLNNYIEK